MTPLFIAVASWCVGILITYLPGSPLWWVSAVCVLPLIAGMWMGYKTGMDVGAERCRQLLRNGSHM